jgi:hypothetical protein
LYSLSEAHVISQDATQALNVIGVHPLDALDLKIKPKILIDDHNLQLVPYDIGYVSMLAALLSSLVPYLCSGLVIRWLEDSIPWFDLLFLALVLNYSLLDRAWDGI